MNDLLYFTLGNYLLTYEWGEYREALRSYYKAYLAKYASLRTLKLSTFGNSKDDLLRDRRFKLDSLDFYCMIEFFTLVELRKVLAELQLEQISFEDMEKVTELVENLIDFYHYADRINTNMVLRTQLAINIKSLLTLTHYFRMPKDLYCVFLS